MEGLMARTLFSGKTLLPVLFLASAAFGDKLVLKDGKPLFCRIRSEADSLIKYFDRHGRPGEIHSGKVDTIIYDSESVNGPLKAVFRKGQPTDITGIFKLRYKEEFETEVTYRTDSLSEIDLFLPGGTFIRVLPNSVFRVLKAAGGQGEATLLRLDSGTVIAQGRRENSLLRVQAPGGVGVGRGRFGLVVKANNEDSSMTAQCLSGLAGIQQDLDGPGELVIEAGQLVRLDRSEGVFKPSTVPGKEEAEWARKSAHMESYRMEAVEYPPIGYWAKAVTGFGFMAFFYGSTLSFLNYVNNI